MFIVLGRDLKYRNWAIEKIYQTLKSVSSHFQTSQSSSTILSVRNVIKKLSPVFDILSLLNYSP